MVKRSRSMRRSSASELNHFSTDLSPGETEMLIKLHRTYHEKRECYKWKFKGLKRTVMALWAASAVLTIGGIAIGIPVSPVGFAITAVGGLITGYIAKSDLNSRTDRCKFAFTVYEKVTNELIGYLRGLKYSKDILMSDLKVIDDIVAERCPAIGAKYTKKYKLVYGKAPPPPVPEVRKGSYRRRGNSFPGACWRPPKAGELSL